MENSGIHAGAVGTALTLALAGRQAAQQQGGVV
jgi:hypothetical protein